VNLNIYPGTSSGPLADPEQSLTFLAQDLSANVGSSGRPVLLYHHFGFDLYSSMWWWETERDAYYQVIKDYNIIMILHGHYHVTLHYMWNGIDVYGTATAPSGVFNVIHITGSQMTIAERTGDDWGFTWQKDLSW
jgi:cytolysin (calcineurin-like family phosphatase)